MLHYFNDKLFMANRMRLDPPSKEVIVFQDEKKVCPECGHVFQGNGYDGIDAHWRSKHEDIMPYREAWPQIKDGTYRRKDASGELSPCASASYWQVK